MAAQIVPLTTSPGASFTAKLSVDGNTLTLQLGLTYNAMANYWVMSVASEAGVPLLDSIPMVTGDYPAGNLLAPYAYLRIGSAYMINASGAATDYPDATNLGSDFLLLWDDTPTA